MLRTTASGVMRETLCLKRKIFISNEKNLLSILYFYALTVSTHAKRKNKTASKEKINFKILQEKIPG